MSVVVGVVGLDGVTLAADTCIEDNVTTHEEVKLARVGDAVVGWTGIPLWGTFVRRYGAPLVDRASVEDFALTWVKWATDLKHGSIYQGTHGIEGSILVGTAGGELYQVSGDGGVCRHSRYSAIGSGAAVAMGALWIMEAGPQPGVSADAERAVLAAIEHGGGCGGHPMMVSTMKGGEE